MTTTMHPTPRLARLRAELGDRVTGPGDPGYDDARAVFVRGINRRPEAIVRPRDADDVAQAVVLARELDLELAVRGGGHSPAGHGTSDGGIVLDLAALRRLDVDPGKRVALAGTGLTAGAVTHAAGAHGLAIGFGDTGSVGIGGLTLGGGVGYLVRAHGLTVDNLLAAELVTADGAILRVDEEQHPDLFWAIRGGGGNFGVATRLRFRLRPVGAVTGGMLVLPATPETIAAFVAAADEAPDEVSAIASVMPAPPLPFVPEEQRGRLVVAATIVHSGPLEAAGRALAPFREIAPPVADLIRPLPYRELFAGGGDAENRPYATARTFFLDAVEQDTAAAILDALSASTAQLPLVQLRVLGGAMARVPRDATAFAHRGSRIMATAAAPYAEPGEAPVHEAWARETAASLRQEDTGAYVGFLADEGPERVRAAYPGATWERLVAVKHRYDPENVFRRNQNVPPSG